VKAAVDGKIEATQLAQKKQNEVATAAAEADKIVEKARGDADSRKLMADAEAYSIQVTGDMLEKYPQVIRLREIEKWDGKYPTTLVGDDSASLLIAPK
jgi:regulator of protease activity HflC (stomatin/prohibitin superfamily)